MADRIEQKAARRWPDQHARKAFEAGAMWALEQAIDVIQHAHERIGYRLGPGETGTGYDARVRTEDVIDALRVLGGKSENTKEDD